MTHSGPLLRSRQSPGILPEKEADVAREYLKKAAGGAQVRKAEVEDTVRRMLADPRSKALATRFAAQWLRLQDVEKVSPDAFWFPNYSRQLMEAMIRETEVFFEQLVRQDRSLL
ncbi:MAG: DUF1592 domain-containing protein, partial [Akkermansiaceae bacterium]|nr:DUF1592 domain-containing protein [Akkermansiaceae bacterium]